MAGFTKQKPGKLSEHTFLYENMPILLKHAFVCPFSYKAFSLSPKGGGVLIWSNCVKQCTEQGVNEDNLPLESPVSFRRTMERRMLTKW